VGGSVWIPTSGLLLICIGISGTYTNFLLFCGVGWAGLCWTLTWRTGFGGGNLYPLPVSVLFHPSPAHRTYLKTRETAPNNHRGRIGGSYLCVVRSSGSSSTLRRHRFDNILAMLFYPIPLPPPLRTTVECGEIGVFP